MPAKEWLGLLGGVKLSERCVRGLQAPVNKDADKNLDELVYKCKVEWKVWDPPLHSQIIC